MYMRKSCDGFSIAMVEYYSVKVLEVEVYIKVLEVEVYIKVLEVETWDCETQKLMGKK